MKDGERELGLKVTGLFIAVKADSDRMVPASRWDSPAVMGALVTEALATGPAVVLGELDAELLPAVVAVQDLVVGHPVRRPGRILHQTCGKEGTMLGGTRGTQHPVPRCTKESSDPPVAPNATAHSITERPFTRAMPGLHPFHPGHNLQGGGPGPEMCVSIKLSRCS